MIELRGSTSLKEQDLSCPICEEIMQLPVRTPCNHRFCSACLSFWLDECPKRTCPMCRADLAETQLIRKEGHASVSTAASSHHRLLGCLGRTGLVGAVPHQEASRIWICRHGEKEPKETRERNFDLLLTPVGASEVEVAAQRISSQCKATGKALPKRIICSPFKRCIVTAGIYAKILNVPCLCVEPGLCEVLTLRKGANGFFGQAPRWHEAELLEKLAATGATDIKFDRSYRCVVDASEIRLEREDRSRTEVEWRAQCIAEQIMRNSFSGDLLVTHGSPAYRLIRALTSQKSFREPPQGCVLEVVATPSGWTKNCWGRVESFEAPLRWPSHRTSLA